jgi:hypothetical protein
MHEKHRLCSRGHLLLPRAMRNCHVQHNYQLNGPALLVSAMKMLLRVFLGCANSTSTYHWCFDSGSKHTLSEYEYGDQRDSAFGVYRHAIRDEESQKHKHTPCTKQKVWAN